MERALTSRQGEAQGRIALPHLRPTRINAVRFAACIAACRVPMLSCERRHLTTSPEGP